MIKYITFKSGGIKDISILKESINILDNSELEYGYRLASLLDQDIYPRVKSINNKRIVKEVFSGYFEQKVKIKKGDFISISDVNSFDIAIDPIILNIPKPIEIVNNEKVDTLTNSKICFLVGRGIGNKENYLRLKNIASRMGIPVGCSRPVCMNGWESYENFVGISGKSLNSDLVVTFGVSGSGPFMKGLENVKTIISINNDKDALIFKYSDYGIVTDISNVLKRLESEYK